MAELERDDGEAEYSILAELGYGERVVALIRDEHLADASMTRLGWRLGTVKIADEHGAPVQTVLDERATVMRAIDVYGGLVTTRIRETLRESEADEVRGRLEPRDPSSITAEEGREQAAEEIIRHSVDALLTVPSKGTLLGLARRFYDEIVEAAREYPQVTVAQLYEAQKGLHGQG